MELRVFLNADATCRVCTAPRQLGPFRSMIDSVVLFFGSEAWATAVLGFVFFTTVLALLKR